MTRPRVAILFSGQPRSVDGISYKSFQKCILEKYDVDVYAHFWGDIEMKKSSGSTYENIETFKRLYNPKAIQVDPPLTPEEYPIDFIQKYSSTPITRHNVFDIPYDRGWTAWVRNCISMYTSMQRVYDVFKANTSSDYDWVIRTRTDCVLLRFPRLDSLDGQYMYAPNWHGNHHPVIVNHTLILPPDIAPVMFNLRNTVENLRGNMDEEFVYNHLKSENLLDRVLTIPLNQFYPTLTRNGIITDRPEPNMTSEVTEPPYQLMMAPRC
jgi:hypothetical protein